ncbi:MAG: hypothetical protein VX278_02085 [Myxococcota bacterium]|nr:hypothetical protein [Myxococcota bacterium]
MHKKILFAFVPLFIVLSVAIGAEIWLRRTTLSKEFVQFLFFTEFKVSRWSYLNQLKGRLLIDQVLQTIPGTTYIEPPEANRPPFDRVPYPYEVTYNNMGFRDGDFQLPKGSRKRVVVLGDSVAFGKGVDQEQSFPAIIDQKREDLEVWNLGLQGCTAECMNRIVKEKFVLFQPDLIIMQSSGNDLDQTLWKSAQKDVIPATSIRSLQLVQRSLLLQWFLRLYGQDTLKRQLELTHKESLKRYGPDIRNIMDYATKESIPIISLNLPFAYDYYYGTHQEEICRNYPDICLSNIRMKFEITERQKQDYASLVEKDYTDFVTATAASLQRTESEMEQIFPLRAYFHDVCHLSPLGHALTAEKLLGALEGF